MYSAAWHHVHLYSPRSINIDSNMPSYRFLYERRRIRDARSEDALQLTGSDAPPEGWEVVPSFDAKCLVAYLMALNQSHPVNEVRSVAGAPVAPEICAPKKDCQPVNRDQPNREWLGADAWFAFFALNRSVHLLDVGLFAVIHSLAYARRRFRFFVHCVVILQEQATAVAIPRARALLVRLRLISLRSADAID